MSWYNLLIDKRSHKHSIRCFSSVFERRARIVIAGKSMPLSIVAFFFVR